MLHSDELLGGLQLDLQFDPALASPGEPEATLASTSYRVDGELVDPGVYRLLISATSASGLPDGGIAALPVSLLQSIAPGSSALTISEVIVANAYGLQSSYEVSPFIQLIKPLVGNLEPGQPFEIGADADFSSSGVDQIDILVDGVLAGSLSSGSSKVQWSPAEPGPTRVVALGRRDDGSSFESDSIELQVAGQRLLNFPSWQSYHFGDAADDDAISDPLADADGDQRWNIWEYAEGTHPLVKDQPPLDRRPFFVSDDSGRYLAIRMRRRIQTDDLSLGALARSNLTKTPEEAVATQLEQAGNFEIVTFHTRLSTTESPTGFLQIEVDLEELPPPASDP